MPDNANRQAGVCYIAVDGRNYAVAGAGSYRPSSPTRETLMGQDGYHGVKEMPAAGKISWTGRDSGGVSLADLADLANVTVTLELANGKMVIGRNMTRVGEAPTVNTEEATFDIEFEGPSVVEA
jgi:hypothetical protein